MCDRYVFGTGEERSLRAMMGSALGGADFEWAKAGWQLYRLHALHFTQFVAVFRIRICIRDMDPDPDPAS